MPLIRDLGLLTEECRCQRLPDIHKMGVTGCFYEHTDVSFCVRGSTRNGVTGVRHIVRDIQDSGSRAITQCGVELFASPDVGFPNPHGSVEEIAFDIAMPTCPGCVHHVTRLEPEANGEFALSSGPLAGPWFPPNIPCRFQDQSGITHYSTTVLRRGQGVSLCGAVEDPLALSLALQSTSHGPCLRCLARGEVRSQGHGMAFPGIALVEEEEAARVREEESEVEFNFDENAPAPSHLLGVAFGHVHVLRPATLTTCRPLCLSEGVSVAPPFFAGPATLITCPYCPNILQRAGESEPYGDREARRYLMLRVGDLWHLEGTSEGSGPLCAALGPVQVKMSRYLAETETCVECLSQLVRGHFVPWETGAEGVPPNVAHAADLARERTPEEPPGLPSRFDRVVDDD